METLFAVWFVTMTYVPTGELVMAHITETATSCVKMELLLNQIHLDYTFECNYLIAKGSEV